jgi:hypothetical protein
MKFLILLITCSLLQVSYTQQWTSNYNNPFPDYSVDAAADNNGNLYVTAQSEDSDTHNDIAVIKYNSSGAEQWVHRYQNTAPDFGVFPLEIECSGNSIYVNAYVLDEDTVLSKQLLIKYNGTGSVQWVKTHTFNTTASVKIKTDNSGNIIAVFPLLNSVTVLKYDPDGNLLWTYNTSEFILMFNGAEQDSAGNIYLLGAGFDCIIQKVNPAGNLVWSRTYNPTGNSDFGNSVCTDKNGNIIVTGYSTESFSASTAFTVKYSPAGDTIWSETISEPGRLLEGEGVVTDSAGNVWIAYSSEDENGMHSLGIIKYNSSGVPVWDSLYSGSNNIIFTNMAIDHTGRLAIAGLMIGGNSDMLLLRSDLSGRVVTEFTSGTPATEEYTGGLAVDNTGDVFLTGTVVNGSTSDVITYGFMNTIGIHQTQAEIPDGYILGQNYPNPFNPATNIQFSVPRQGLIKLVVYDITGKEVSGLVNKQLKPGTYKVDFDAAGLTSGVYFYKLSAEGFTETKKMILVK